MKRLGQAPEHFYERSDCNQALCQREVPEVLASVDKGGVIPPSIADMTRTPSAWAHLNPGWIAIGTRVSSPVSVVRAALRREDGRYAGRAMD